jgi:hypothetical protein
MAQDTQKKPVTLPNRDPQRESEEKDRYIAEEERKRLPINKRDFEEANKRRSHTTPGVASAN